MILAGCWSRTSETLTGMKALRPFAADRRKTSQQGKEAAPVAQEATVQRAPELRRQGSPENRLSSLLNHEDRATLRLKLKAQFLKPLGGNFSCKFRETMQISDFTHFSAPPFLISPQSVGPPGPTSSTPPEENSRPPKKSGTETNLACRLARPRSEDPVIGLHHRVDGRRAIRRRLRYVGQPCEAEALYRQVTQVRADCRASSTIDTIRTLWPDEH